MVTRDGDPIKILLADDDDDDRFLFGEALNDVNPNTSLKTVEYREKLMKYLASVDGEHPDTIFLDINMPCEDGKECLKEIRSAVKLILICNIQCIHCVCCVYHTMQHTGTED